MKRVDIFTRGRIHVLVVDGVEQCSRIGPFSDEEVARWNQEESPDRLAVRAEWPIHLRRRENGS